jgi:hypothetical protein
MATLLDVLLPQQLHVFQLQPELRKTTHCIALAFHTHELFDLPTGFTHPLPILSESTDDVWASNPDEEHPALHVPRLIFVVFAP